MRRLSDLLEPWIGRKAIFPSLALVLLAIAGAFLATWLSWPLPYVLGPLAFVAIFQIAGGKTTKIAELRKRMVAVLGLYLGSAFTPELLASVPGWSASLVMVAVLVPVTMFMGYGLFRLIFGLDKATAWFSAVPGGLTEMSIFGEMEGGDAQTIATLQTMRVVGMIVLIPLTLSLFLTIERSSMPITDPQAVERPWSDWFWYLVAVVGFQALGRRLPIPAGFFTVPMIGSSLLYGLGVIETPPPLWLIIFTQVILGAGLGQRFEYRPLSYWLLNLKRFWLHACAIVALAAFSAFVLAPYVPAEFAPLFLAFTPGGLAEMSLIAVALDTEAVFVTSHHLLRIVVAMFVGTWLFSLISGSKRAK